MCSACDKRGKKRRESNKINKKVSRFRDKDGHIKKEMQECIEFVNELKKNNAFVKACSLNLIEEDFKFKKMNRSEIALEIAHKLKRSFNKNHYSIQKAYKEEGFSIYQNKDIYLFLLVLFEAAKQNKVKEFLDIPDVFYILRQIKGVGINYYFNAA